MNIQNKPDTPPAREEEKIVNVLGIKQSWWQTTSIIHAVLMVLYGAWYIGFQLDREGRVSDMIHRFAVHILAVSGLTMLAMIAGIHLGVLTMMLHEWYRNKLSARRRALEESVRTSEAARLAAEEAARTAEEAVRTAAETIAQLQAEREAQQAWNERRLRAQEDGERFDEPMPNGHPQDVVAQLEQEQADYQAWFERRIAAARQGEPFDEPPPNNGTDGTNGS